ncbi:terpenoid synthase [Daldinia vernicosa]|uniref:terpenoid synthase n=1 Tax=Daldinia vernicosa TaxID=114800 RepID=UPI002008565A|nr:terpenoid synthase [Daldinia vernicosa]KAI0851331.1 terpenoid synthase [Daldinia vernicosa]
MATIQEVKVAAPDIQPLLPPDDPREQLLSSIRGSRVFIPDLQTMISHWPRGSHPDIERLDKHVQEIIASLSSSTNSTARLRKLRATNITSFTAAWWPYASYEALETVARLTIWLFACDDEIDSTEVSTIINDWDIASTFRQRTIDYVQQSLSRIPKSRQTETNPLITCTGPIGEALLKSCNDRQISTYLSEVLLYVNMGGEEQKYQVARRLPTVEEYLGYRSGTSAVRVCFATIEYAWGMTLPQELFEDDDMRQLWYEIGVAIYVTNDILSIKKEVEESQVNSLVPLLSLQLGSVQAAINRAVDIVYSSVQRFESVEKRILLRYSTMPEVQEDIRKFIDACKYAATANLNWSLTTGRYKVHCESMSSGIYLTL